MCAAHGAYDGGGPGTLQGFGERMTLEAPSADRSPSHVRYVLRHGHVTLRCFLSAAVSLRFHSYTRCVTRRKRGRTSERKRSKPSALGKSMNESWTCCTPRAANSSNFRTASSGVPFSR